MQTLRRDTLALSLALLITASSGSTGSAESTGSTKELARAQKVYDMLVEQQTLRNNKINYEGTEYGVTGWQVCPAFNGVCLLTASPGQNALVLAAFETVPGEVQVMGVKLKEYRKGRAQEAVQHYIKSGAATMNTVFALKDPAGNPIFGKDGTLTAFGETAYEGALRGVKQEAAPPPKEDKGSKEAARKAMAEIKTLLKNGYMELGTGDYDCVRKVYKKFDDGELGIKTVMYKQSPRRFLHNNPLDPTVVIVQEYRKNGFCGNSAVEQR